MRFGIDTTFLVQVEVREHPGHDVARRLLEELIQAEHRIAVAPQVLAEFVHIVTDRSRFENPLTVHDALAKAGEWWNAREIDHVFPASETVAQFLVWMADHRLGRKRLLDTMLAATYQSHGIETVISSNARDYRVFGCFRVMVPGETTT